MLRTDPEGVAGRTVAAEEELRRRVVDLDEGEGEGDERGRRASASSFELAERRRIANELTRSSPEELHRQVVVDPEAWLRHLEEERKTEEGREGGKVMSCVRPFELCRC